LGLSSERITPMPQRADVVFERRDKRTEDLLYCPGEGHPSA